MDKWAQENHSYCPSSEEFERSRKIGISHWTNQAEMHRWNSDQTSEKQSQLWAVSTANLEKNDLNQSFFVNTKGGIRLLLPVPHGGSGMKLVELINKRMSNISELVDWAASKNRETRWGRLLIKLITVECWQELVFSRVAFWWIDGSLNRETCLWTTTGFVHRAHGQIHCWWRWYGL